MEKVIIPFKDLKEVIRAITGDNTTAFNKMSKERFISYCANKSASYLEKDKDQDKAIAIMVTMDAINHSEKILKKIRERKGAK